MIIDNTNDKSNDDSNDKSNDDSNDKSNDNKGGDEKCEDLEDNSPEEIEIDEVMSALAEDQEESFLLKEEVANLECVPESLDQETDNSDVEMIKEGGVHGNLGDPVKMSENPAELTPMTYTDYLLRMITQKRKKDLVENGETIDISSDEDSQQLPQTKNKRSRTSDSAEPGHTHSKRPKTAHGNELELISYTTPQFQFTTSIPKENFSVFGGFTSILKEVTELVVHIKEKTIYEALGATPPRGFLLHGPQGCGKTLLAKAIAGELSVPLVRLSGLQLAPGVSAVCQIKEAFKYAENCSPSILFLDELDSLCPVADLSRTKILRQLIVSLDGLGETLRGSRVVVIGATNCLDSLHPSFRRAGRFDRQIYLGIPDKSARLQILSLMLSSIKIQDGLSLEEIAAATHGFLGVDIKALISQAALAALNRARDEERTAAQVIEEPENIELKDKNLIKGPPISTAQLTNTYIEMKDFKTALKKVQPSETFEQFPTVPNLTWDDIGSLRDIRSEVERLFQFPLKHPNKSAEFGISKPAGILFYGPAGCGKTSLAKAVASEANIRLISLGPELLFMDSQESERVVRQCFQRARDSQPCIIFFDEVDEICPNKTASVEGNNSARQLLLLILTEMDRVAGQQVFLMGATKRLNLVEPAVLRTGRLDTILRISLPTGPDRAEILRILTKNGTIPKIKGVDLDKIGNDNRLSGFSGTDLVALLREASFTALSKFIRSNCDESNMYVTEEIFEQAITHMKASFAYAKKI